MKQIQNNLKEYRFKAGLTQEQVVKSLGLHSSNRLSRWEAGKAYPSVINLLKIAKFYNIPLGKLYNLAADKKIKTLHC